MSGEEAGTVDVRPGRQIAWRAFGDGPPLLLINGYAATGAILWVTAPGVHLTPSVEPHSAGLALSGRW